MKNSTKVILSMLTIAVFFVAACTKDNSESTQPTTAKVATRSYTSTALARDTIAPQVKKAIASPAVSRDTIAPN